MTSLAERMLVPAMRHGYGKCDHSFSSRKSVKVLCRYPPLTVDVSDRA